MSLSKALAAFDALLDLTEEQRNAFLADLHARDPEQAVALRRLLAADQGEGLLDAEVDPSLTAAPAALDRSGQRIGQYRLLARIGQGGMGEVYRAEREAEGYTQAVAIKLLRRGFESEQLVKRFVQEQRILARLEHPGIARLIDGGIDSQGGPWLAMELVEGEPLIDHARRLGLQQRLRLLVAVCEAVDYANRRLIVHRDLKPSNVLVGIDGAPRLLDFGIAKLLDQPSDDALTQTGAGLLSPAYAAPEQVLGEPAGLATDVYTLGLLLYELLTDELPQQRRTRKLSELALHINEEVQRPSALLQKQTMVTTESMTARQVAGDLDTITLKALAAEPDRRYASAAALADDLQRFLEGRPIAARPDTAGYRLAKFVRRHRGGVAASVLVMLALIGGLALSLWQAQLARLQAVRADAATLRAEAEAASARDMAARAERVKAFLISVFQQEDPLRRDARGALTMADALEDSIHRIDSEFADDPGMQGALFDDFGEIMAGKGDLERAEELFKRALVRSEQALGPDSPAVAESLVNLGVISGYRGRLVEGKPYLERALRILEKSSPPNADAMASVLMALGNVERDRGDIPAATGLMQRALDVIGGPDGGHPDRLAAMNNLAILKIDGGDYASARPLMEKVVELTEQQQGPAATPLIVALATLQQIAEHDGDMAGAMRLGERRLAIARQSFAGDHLWLASSLVEHGANLSEAGDFATGEANIREGIAMHERIGGHDMSSVGAWRRLAISQRNRGDLAAARESMQSAVALCHDPERADNLVCLTARAGRAHLQALAADDRVARIALAEIDAVLANLRQRYPDSLDEQSQALTARAAALQSLGRHDEALVDQNSALDLLTRQYGTDHPSTRQADRALQALKAAQTAPTP